MYAIRYLTKSTFKCSIRYIKIESKTLKILQNISKFQIFSFAAFKILFKICAIKKFSAISSANEKKQSSYKIILSYKSYRLGLMLSINSNFFFLDTPLICFPLAIA